MTSFMPVEANSWALQWIRTRVLTKIQDYAPRERFTTILANKAIQGPLPVHKERWHGMASVHSAKQAFPQNKAVSLRRGRTKWWFTAHQLSTVSIVCTFLLCSICEVPSTVRLRIFILFTVSYDQVWVTTETSPLESLSCLHPHSQCLQHS